MSKIGSFAPSREEAIAAAVESIAPPATTSPDYVDGGLYIYDAAANVFDWPVEGYLYDQAMNWIRDNATPGSVFVGFVDGAARFEKPSAPVPGPGIQPGEFLPNGLYCWRGPDRGFEVVADVPQGVADPVLAEASLSDLFFNYEHSNYDSLMRKHRKGKGKEDDTSPTDEEVHAALLADAVDFTDTLRNATGIKLDREAVVADFLKRL